MKARQKAGLRLPLAAAASALVFAGCLRGPAISDPTPAPRAAKSPPPTPTATPAPAGPLKTKTSGLAITAIEFGASNDVVARVKNLNSQPIDLSAEKYEVCINFIYGKVSKTLTTIPAGAEVRVHLNSPAGCAESATEFCVEESGFVTASKGNLSIYRGISNDADFSKPALMDDFVSWGFPAEQPRESEAVDAALWLASRSVPVTSGLASISVKVVGASGPDNWQ